MPFDFGLLTEWDLPVDPENPLSDGGRWSSYFNREPLIGHVGSVGNGADFVVCGMYWNADIFIADPAGGIIEAYACPTGGGLGAALDSWRLGFWLGHPDQITGYLAGFGGGIGQDTFFRRYDGGGAWTTIGFEEGGPGPEMMGLRITPTHVQQWRKVGGVWSIVPGCDIADTTHRGGFFLSLENEGQGCVDCIGWDCVGAAQVNHTQIYRRITGGRLPLEEVTS